MSLEDLIELMHFALDNAFIRMPDGTIWKQCEGIPMGDPLSPAMTILTRAWMENEWLKGMSPETKAFFHAARFMDDIQWIWQLGHFQTIQFCFNIQYLPKREFSL